MRARRGTRVIESAEPTRKKQRRRSSFRRRSRASRLRVIQLPQRDVLEMENPDPRSRAFFLQRFTFLHVVQQRADGAAGFFQLGPEAGKLDGVHEFPPYDGKIGVVVKCTAVKPGQHEGVRRKMPAGSGTGVRVAAFVGGGEMQVKF